MLFGFVIFLVKRPESSFFLALFFSISKGENDIILPFLLLFLVFSCIFCFKYFPFFWLCSFLLTGSLIYLDASFLYTFKRFFDCFSNNFSSSSSFFQIPLTIKDKRESRIIDKYRIIIEIENLWAKTFKICGVFLRFKTFPETSPFQDFLDAHNRSWQIILYFENIFHNFRKNRQ